MAAETIGALRAELSANSAQFEQDMGRARDAVRQSAAGMRSDFNDLKKGTDDSSSSFEGLFSLLKGGLTAAGVTTGIGAIIAAFKSINDEMLQLAGNSKTLEMPVEQLQEMALAAKMFGGLSNSTFFTGLQSMARQMHDATLSENDLSRLFDANNQKLTDRNGKLISINQALMIAADLVKNAGDEQWKIQIAERLGLTKEWVDWLEKGSTQIDVQIGKVKQMGVTISDDVIQAAKEFDRQWSETWDAWVAYGKKSALELKDWLKQTWNAGSFVPGAAGDVDVFGAPPEEGPRTGVAPTGVGGVDESGFITFAKGLPKQSPAKPTVVPPKGGDSGDGGRDPFQRAVDQTNKSIAVMNAETATIGENSEARERARVVATLEEAAKRANTQAGLENTDVTDEQRTKINALADAMFTAAQKNRETQQQFQSFNQTLQFSGSLAVEFFDALGDKSKSMADVVVQMMGKVKTAILNALIVGEGPLAGLLGTKSTVSGGTGGLFGAFAGLFTGPHADGGTIPAGHWGTAGENGIEAVFAGASPLSVMPADKFGGPGGGITVQNTNVNQFAAGINGTDMAAINAQIARASQQTVSTTVQVIRAGVRNNQSFLTA